MSRMIDKVLKKNWSDQDVLNMVGDFRETFKGFALIDRLQFGGASGGVTTALLLYALEQGLIDGAVVCRTRITADHRVRARFCIAKSREELLCSQGSKYVRTHFVSEALKLIDEFDGRLAVVGLPCDLRVLKRRMEKNPRLAEKISFTIGLFCGHNSREQLIDNVVEKLKPRQDSKLEGFRFRVGLWRGYSLARFDGNETVEKQFSYYSLYQNLYFFCQKKCLYCHDHFAYYADIALGDIWSFDLKKEKVKYNSIICRSKEVAVLLDAAHESGYLELEPAGISEVLDGQSRTAPTHHNMSAKNRAGKRFGMNIPDKHNKKVKWHEYCAAWIILFNYNWSLNKRRSGYIFKMPRKLLKTYLYVLKALESIR